MSAANIELPAGLVSAARFDPGNILQEAARLIALKL
jgi:hypothetical protein